MSDPTVRPAHRVDLQGLLALYGEIRPEKPAQAVTAAVASAWDAMLAEERSLVVVAELDGALVATAMLAIVASIARGGAPFGLIEHVVTAAAYRQRGHGERVLRYLLAQAWQRGCYKVMLLSGQQRPDAHRLYARLGFDGDTERGFVVKNPQGPR